MALVQPSKKERLNLGSPADVERAGSQWGMHLVAGESEEIAANSLYVQRNLSGGLYRVRMEVDVGLLRDPAYLAHWLQHSRFVVRRHYGDKLCSQGKSAPNIA